MPGGPADGSRKRLQGLVTPMARHVKIVAWLYILHGALYVLLGLGAFGLLRLAGRYFDKFDPGGEMPMMAGPMLQMLGSMLAIVAVIISIPRLLAGFGLLSLRPWARTLTLVLATLGFVDFPIGSAIGAYAYWVLLSNEGSDLFRIGGVRREPPPLPPLA